MVDLRSGLNSQGFYSTADYFLKHFPFGRFKSKTDCYLGLGEGGL